jgi:hypothetical protein
MRREKKREERRENRNDELINRLGSHSILLGQIEPSTLLVSNQLRLHPF